MKLDEYKSIANIIGILAIPIITLIVGNSYTTSIKEREIQSRYVELAIDILRNEPTKENKNLRSWAVEIINTYSAVVIDTETSNELINKIPIQEKLSNLYDKKLGEIRKLHDQNPEDIDSLGVLYIELAELGIESGNLFMAKATLGSIIENHSDDTIRKKAQMLLKKIENKN